MERAYEAVLHELLHDREEPSTILDEHAGQTLCPRQDSNLRHLFRREVLYPLSYGGARPGYRTLRVFRPTQDRLPVSPRSSLLRLLKCPIRVTTGGREEVTDPDGGSHAATA